MINYFKIKKALEMLAFLAEAEIAADKFSKEQGYSPFLKKTERVKRGLSQDNIDAAWDAAFKALGKQNPRPKLNKEDNDA